MKLKIFILILVSAFIVSAESKYSSKVYSRINDKKLVPENSTILKSKKYERVFWTLNDSGNSAAIFAIDEKGNLIRPTWVKKYNGIKVIDAVNIDWEAMTYDSDGNIIIEDAGNNFNYRTDLALYKIAEPNPYLANKQGIIAKYPFKYPDQKKYPDENDMNYDCEALFSFKGKIHLISKNRTGTVAKLYRFNELKPWQMNIPKKIDEFDFKSMVTDAAISEDESKLLILTYDYIWLFEIDKNQYNPFNTKKIYRKKINLGQCEGIDFTDSENFIVSNEEGDIFKFNLNYIRK